MSLFLTRRAQLLTTSSTKAGFVDEAVVSPAENLRSSRTVHRTLLQEGQPISQVKQAVQAEAVMRRAAFNPACKKQKTKAKRYKNQEKKDAKTKSNIRKRKEGDGVWLFII